MTSTINHDFFYNQEWSPSVPGNESVLECILHHDTYDPVILKIIQDDSLSPHVLVPLMSKLAMAGELIPNHDDVNVRVDYMWHEEVANNRFTMFSWFLEWGEPEGRNAPTAFFHKDESGLIISKFAFVKARSKEAHEAFIDGIQDAIQDQGQSLMTRRHA